MFQSRREPYPKYIVWNSRLLLQQTLQKSSNNRIEEALNPLGTPEIQESLDEVWLFHNGQLITLSNFLLT